MISFRQKGSFAKTERFFRKSQAKTYMDILLRAGEEGLRALAEATPKDSGLTASSWVYTVRSNKGGLTLSWSNTNTNNGENVAILIQYGHGTKSGGYIQGRDYINPAIRPLFDRLAKEVWGEVTT